MAICTFKRYEKKYLLDEEKYNALQKKLEGKMKVDEYGLSKICNIYFDTDSFYLVRESIEKPDYKEKFRVRSYGIPDKDGKVFLEIKKKYDGVVYKRRIVLPYTEAMDYLEKGIKPKEDSQIFREIDYFLNLYDAKAKVYLAYDRIAMYGAKDSSVRITFDRNIRSRLYDLDLAKGDYGEKLMADGNYLMEVKVSGAMPLWLAKIMSELDIKPVSFSKYGNVYKKSIVPNKLVAFVPAPMNISRVV